MALHARLKMSVRKHSRRLRRQATGSALGAAFAVARNRHETLLAIRLRRHGRQPLLQRRRLRLPFRRSSMRPVRQGPSSVSIDVRSVERPTRRRRSAATTELRHLQADSLTPGASSTTRAVPRVRRSCHTPSDGGTLRLAAQHFERDNGRTALGQQRSGKLTLSSYTLDRQTRAN